jgi:hypothetical protein
MLYQATVKRAWYDIQGRKYLNLEFDGTTKQVKVPFRYGRVMCRVNGLTPIQDMPEGSVLECVIERKSWDGETFWILHSVTSCRLPTRIDVSR